MSKREFKKLSTNAKKVIILCSMVGLLVVTGVLNFVLNTELNKNKDNNSDVIGDAPGTVATFFNSYRSDRETARNEEFSYLDAIIKNELSTEAVIASAESKKLELLKNIETELVLENLIKAKGFDDAVVTMSTNNVNVIIQESTLTSEQVAQILSTIISETNYTPSQVVVVPYSDSNSNQV